MGRLPKLTELEAMETMADCIPWLLSSVRLQRPQCIQSLLLSYRVWQHIDCMGIDRANIPEEYSCEQCMPRKVSKARARMIQKNKLEELTRTSTSEDENANAKRPNSLNLKSSKAKNGGQNSKKLPNGKNGTVIPNGKKKGVTTPAAAGPALRSKVSINNLYPMKTKLSALTSVV